MAKILVLYCSQTGNTEKMARLVVEGAHRVTAMDVRLRSVEEAELADLHWCDGIALGAPTNLGGIPWRMKKWWDEVACQDWAKLDGKFGTVFSSAGGWGGGQEVACMGLMTLLINFGFLVFGVTDYSGSKMTLHYGSVIAGEPRSDGEQESCRRLGQRLAEWLAVYVDGRKDCHPLQQTYPRLPS